MPRSLSGRNMCRPPIDWRSSSAHSLNSTTCPAARVWPWCQRASMFKAKRLSFTAWIGARRYADETDHQPKTQEDSSVKKQAPVVKQLYSLNVEPQVVDQLTKLAS